jgi:hypothetical protein
LASFAPENSTQKTAARNAAAWLARFVEISLTGDVSPETPAQKDNALPSGDRP